MSECNKYDIQALVGEQAAKWFVLLKDGDLNEGERRRYLAWLKQSPSHVAEMRRIERLHGVLKNMLLGQC